MKRKNIYIIISSIIILSISILGARLVNLSTEDKALGQEADLVIELESEKESPKEVSKKITEEKEDQLDESEEELVGRINKTVSRGRLGSGQVTSANDSAANDEVKIIDGIVLVNKDYGVPKDHFTRVDPEAREYLNKMINAAKAEAGLGLKVHSSYRSNELQGQFYKNMVEEKGLEYASIYSAKPGHSEHEIGQAFDICDQAEVHRTSPTFEDSPEGLWLRKNSHRFGFILRYDKDKTHITGYAYEPWHFRYVGEEHAKIIYDNDLTLEEYLLPDQY